MKDILDLLPHSKKEAKVDKRGQIQAMLDLAEMHSCNQGIYLESRKRLAYLWLTHFPNGPSVKFLLHNMHTSKELKFTGNCLKGTRPMISFDKSFAGVPHLELIQEMLTQSFSVPKYHPKSMPFIDHIFSFTQVAGRILFRNFEVVAEGSEFTLVEIGPRFIITPIKIFEGVLSGNVIFANKTMTNLSVKVNQNSKKYKNRIANREARKEREKPIPAEGPTTKEVFG